MSLFSVILGFFGTEIFIKYSSYAAQNMFTK